MGNNYVYKKMPLSLTATIYAYLMLYRYAQPQAIQGYLFVSLMPIALIKAKHPQPTIGRKLRQLNSRHTFLKMHQNLGNAVVRLV